MPDDNKTGSSNSPFFPFDPRSADAAYKSFPSFIEWGNCRIDNERWDLYSSQMRERGKVSTELLERSKEIVRRAAAIDTGALEGLYDVDRGFTFTVATQAALWEAMIDGKGPRVRALIESQLRAYEYVLSLATQQEPISEVSIRILHEQVCESQETYTAYTEIGIQELRLPKGEYKHLPNHVYGKSGKIHSYAPVDLTPAEMHRLCQEMRSELFLASHPVLQASFAHYAFVLIHPFADGNGRVARALASIYTYRSHSIPLLILMENREDYLSSLRNADEGNYQSFVDFIMERALDGIRLVDESLRAAVAPSIDEAAAKLKRLYTTRGGYTHTEVDEAGYLLFDMFFAEIRRQLADLDMLGTVTTGTEIVETTDLPTTESYRRPSKSGKKYGVVFSLQAHPPAQSAVNKTYILEVPIDCGNDDDLIIRDIRSNETFTARMSEVFPTPTVALKIRLDIAVRRILGESLNELTKRAAASLKSNGY